MDSKIMLIDANSLLYRAFFALPPLENSKGQPTGAVYGFTNMLMKLFEDYPVDYAVAAFDLPGPTKRTQEYSEYKAHRPPTPDDLRSQMKIARDVLDALGVVRVELEGYEADDLVGTLARTAVDNNCFAWIVSGDRDILQVVDENIKVILTQKGISQTIVYDPSKVEERYQVIPPKLVDIKGLMGDTSDNIPGVPGIGEKTAIKLISQFGSVDGVLGNLDQLKGKMKERLEDNKDMAILSRKLAEIVTDAPLDLKWPPPKVEADNQRLYELFKDLEFNRLLERLELAGDDAKPAMVEYVDSYPTQELLKESVLPVMILDKSTVVIGHGEKNLVFGEEVAGTAFGVLEEFIGTEDKVIITDDAKTIYRFAMDREVAVNCQVHSCQLAAYLLKPGSTLDVPSILRTWTQEGPEKQSGQSDKDYLAAHVSELPKLWEILDGQMIAVGVAELYKDVELPLSKVLARMEKTGIAVDVAELESIGELLTEKITQLEGSIHGQAGCTFNISSPKQLGEILFERLELPPARKTKTGWSTDVSVLESLREEHEIIPQIIDYRQLVKLQSTYIEGLKNVWDKDSGRIFTTFNQMVTATGRLSSVEPNLQNIPIRLEEGRKIRKAFVAGGGYRWLLAADYSQIELRILAHIAKDKTLLEAFRNNQDIHSRTAAEIFEVDLDAVTSDQRRAAKAVNFGLVYGQTDFGLAKSLGITKAQAGAYIDAYFKNYPGVKEYMEEVVAQGRENGYVSTLLGRVRYLPEIKSRNFQRRSFAERTAINTPIQGTAADIIKLAMVEVEKRLEKAGLVSRMLLQVHDELVLEVPQDELQRAADLVRRGMAQVLDLDVPLVVDVKYGPNWYSMETMEE